MKYKKISFTIVFSLLILYFFCSSNKLKLDRYIIQKKFLHKTFIKIMGMNFVPPMAHPELSTGKTVQIIISRLR